MVLLEVGEGFVACFGFGDVDVEDEDAGFGAGGNTDSVVRIWAGEPFGDCVEVTGGGLCPVVECRPFLSWSDWDYTPASLGVVDC